MADLPDAVAAELRRLFNSQSGLADAGEPFNATDVVFWPLPHLRFLRAIRRGDRWAVWYEHGGLGYHGHVQGVRVAADGRARVDPFGRFSGQSGEQLCRASQAYFDGVASATDS